MYRQLVVLTMRYNFLQGFEQMYWGKKQKMTIYLSKWIIAAILLIGHTSFSFADEVVSIDEPAYLIQLNNHVQLCEVSVVDINQITNENFFRHFDSTCFNSPDISNSLLGKAYLGKIGFRSTYPSPIDMVLTMGRSDLITINAILCEDSLLEVKKAGMFLKRSDKDLKEGNMTSISFRLYPHTTYYIFSYLEKHYSHLNPILSINFEAMPLSNWHQRIQQKRSFEGVFLGLMLMMILFALFFYYQTGQIEYLYYALFQLTGIWNFIVLEDFSGSYIFPNSPSFRAYLASAPLLGLGTFYLLFIRAYLSSLRTYKNWNWVFNFFISFSLLLSIIVVLISYENYQPLFLIVNIWVGISTIFSTFSVIFFYIDNPSKLRSYLLWGACILCLGYGLNYFNLKNQFIAQDGIYIMSFALLIEALIFGAGMAFKTGLIEKEKIKLQEQQLIIEKEKENLQEIGKLKSRLYTNITHEFRTPLTIILGLSKQLASQVAAQAVPNLELIQRNGRQLLELINQMLDLSKLEAGKLKLDYVHGDIVNFLKYLTESFHSVAENQAIQLHFLSDLEELSLDYEPKRLQQVFFNLISNALKYSQEGGHIYIQVSQLPSDYMELKIRDTGMGIPEKELGKIFDRFYQVEENDSRKSGGTGIGLALVKELVNLMGGVIQVKSKLGKGSEFSFSLPIKHSMIGNEAIDYEVQTVSSNSPSLVKAKIPSLPDSPLLLILEDNRDVLHYITSSLSSHFRIESCPDGQTGIEQALKRIPDLIISDVMMPIKNGFEVCEDLKQDRRTSHIPIILLTAKADIQSKLEGLQYGADLYLEKPFHEEELLLHINNLLQQRQRLKIHYQFLGNTDPNDKAEEVLPPESVFVEQVRSIIFKNLNEPSFTVDQLSKEVALSPSQLHRKLKALTGYSAIQIIRLIRLGHAQKLLKNPEIHIANVAYDCGFNNPDYFSKTFKKEFGLSPSEFRKEQIKIG